jgi:trehalose-6-phosphate synthase
MPLEERRARMQRMRSQLRRATIFDWLEAILARVDELAAPPTELRPPAERSPFVELGVRSSADASAA